MHPTSENSGWRRGGEGAGVKARVDGNAGTSAGGCGGQIGLGPRTGSDYWSNTNEPSFVSPNRFFWPKPYPLNVTTSTITTTALGALRRGVSLTASVVFCFSGPHERRTSLHTCYRFNSRSCPGYQTHILFNHSQFTCPPPSITVVYHPPDGTI